MASSVLSLEQGTALVAKRLDVDDVVEDSMSVIQPHLWGYDAFALHSRDIDRVEDIGLIFGAPWWDYMLPYSLILGGVSLRSISGPSGWPWFGVPSGWTSNSSLV